MAKTKPKWPICSQCGRRHAELKPGMCAAAQRKPRTGLVASVKGLQVGPSPSPPGSRLKGGFVKRPKGKGR